VKRLVFTVVLCLICLGLYAAVVFDSNTIFHYDCYNHAGASLTESKAGANGTIIGSMVFSSVTYYSPTITPTSMVVQ
jgi:hypothetical protein